MNYRVNKVNFWNGWDPLKQVILGNVFEPSFLETYLICNYVIC